MRDTFSNFNEMLDCVQERGFLPFFTNEIPQFSIEELCPSELWYHDTGFENGTLLWAAWEWKGPAIVEGDLAYGKFFRGKAGFVSMEWFPDFVNVRRATAALTDVERAMLELLRSRGSLLSGEIKREMGLTKPKTPRQTPLAKVLEKETPRPRQRSGRENFETSITRLQMSTHVVTADFEYRYDRTGRRYGWGIARYCTPEDFFGADRLACPRTPEESRARILAHLRQILPQASDRVLDRLI